MLRKIIVILQRYPENNLFTLKGLIPIEDKKRLPVRVIALFFFAYLFGSFTDFLYLCARFSPWWLNKVVARSDTPCGKTR